MAIPEPGARWADGWPSRWRPLIRETEADRRFKRGRAARVQLARAIEQRPDEVPCLTSSQPELWISDDPEDRAEAAEACRLGECPVWTACGKAATVGRETFGVWAGRDRTILPTPEMADAIAS